MSKTTSSKLQIIEVVPIILAIAYAQSVLTVAHHTSMWVHDGTSRLVEASNVWLLVVCSVLCGYSWYAKRKPSQLIAISLTILATASIFWLSGLRTNFYF